MGGRGFLTAQPAQENVKTGVVVANRLNMRSGPSAYHPVVGNLVSGNKVDVYIHEGDWYHIGDNRWVNKAFISLEEKSFRKGKSFPTV